MTIVNFGSLNIDRVYRVADFTIPGRTITAKGLEVFAGGKGLNQSIAAARAGAVVVHGGRVGADGTFLLDAMRAAGVDVSSVGIDDSAPSGHAVIQVSDAGENSIIVLGGANQGLDEDYVRGLLSRCAPGDLLMTQNETNLVPFILEEAKRRGLQVCFNPSPIDDRLPGYPLGIVDRFILNGDEAEAIAGRKGEPDLLLDLLLARFPKAEVVLTLGSRGAVVADGRGRWHAPAFPVTAVDTTGAGDCFAGYYLAAIAGGEKSARARLRFAQRAASICVGRPGASPSIPTLAEVLAEG